MGGGGLVAVGEERGRGGRRDMVVGWRSIASSESRSRRGSA